MTDSETSDAPPALDLRVARVLSAREHPNADRLLILDIDLGDDERQIVAGIVDHYTLEELDGRHIVVVANLQPARLRGEVSDGMLLAAEGDEGELALLVASGAEPGTRLTTASAPEPARSVSFQDFLAHEIRATPDEVSLDGEPLEGAELAMDREVYGLLR